MAEKMVIIRVDSHIDDVMEEVNRRIKLALGSAGEIIEGYAKEDCPVDTGLLRNSLTYAVSGEKPAISNYHADRTSTRESATTGKSGSVGIGRYKEVVGNANDPCVYVGTNVEYAPYVEFGSANHLVGKSHFLRDAGQKHIPEIKETIEKILSRE